jgi:hypothetical protein
MLALKVTGIPDDFSLLDNFFSVSLFPFPPHEMNERQASDKITLLQCVAPRRTS